MKTYILAIILSLIAFNINAQQAGNLTTGNLTAGLISGNGAGLTNISAIANSGSGLGITNNQITLVNAAGNSANDLYSASSGNFSYLALGYNGAQGAEIGYVGSAGQFFANSLQGDYVNKEVTGSHYMRLGTGAGNSTLDLAPGGGVATFNTNVVVSGNITGNGVGITNIQPFLIQTNFLLTKQYTNTYGCTITVSASVVTTTAAVAGDSSIALMAVSSPLVGGWTNTVGVGTTGSSLAVSYTNVLSIYVPTNSPYWFTNTSSGAGDTVSVLGGQIKYP
jgi:hypothetical protein